MANINAMVKRKQFIWLAIISLILSGIVGGAWYFSEMDISDSNKSVVTKEPAPDLTGVVDSQFDGKVQKHAITETQAAQAEIKKEFSALRQEIDLLSKARQEDQRRIETLSEENKKLSEQFGEPGNSNATMPGNPGFASQPISNGFSPEGEPLPSKFPPSGNRGAVPPPTEFYPGRGGERESEVTYRSVPVPGQINRKRFSYEDTETKEKKYPYIPTGSFAKSILIEGADANASVTGNEATVPMQVRLIGKVEMPNSKTYDLTGCFVNMEAYGDVSSERALVRALNLSCIKGKDIIDQEIDGHVSFMGKNGIKGEVVMRNGKILMYAWGAGFLDGIGSGVSTAAQPVVGLGGTASVGAGDIFKSGVGGGTSKSASMLSEYYIKRAEQFHAIIPIGAGNEVTVVFHKGFQIKTIEEVEEAKRGNQPKKDNRGESLNGFSTEQMLNKLGKIDFNQFSEKGNQQESEGE
ncbi:conjugal transfer protein TraB [Serratia sp. S1B]|nr:conjugal transfer protein TraB [Serratia sp. S1B]